MYLVNVHCLTCDSVCEVGRCQVAPIESEDVQGVVLLVVPGEDDVALVGDVEKLHSEGEIVSRGPDGPHVLSFLHTVDVDGACVG